jgi:hypothetical protein
MTKELIFVNGVSKICVLLVFWTLFGAAIYLTTCAFYTIKVALLNYDDVDELEAEFVNLMTNNIMDVKKTDTRDEIYRKVSNLTGEPVGKHWVRMWFLWPDTMAKVQPVMKAAYETMRDKYGVRSFGKRAT